MKANVSNVPGDRDRMEELRLEFIKQGLIVVEPSWPSNCLYNPLTKKVKFFELLKVGERMTQKKGRFLQMLKEAGFDIEIVIYSGKSNLASRIRRLPFEGMDVRIIETTKQEIRQKRKQERVNKNKVTLTKVREVIIKETSPTQQKPSLNQEVTYKQTVLEAEKRDDLKEFQELFKILQTKTDDLKGVSMDDLEAQPEESRRQLVEEDEDSD